jgi:hypothetical protein
VGCGPLDGRLANKSLQKVGKCSEETLENLNDRPHSQLN